MTKFIIEADDYSSNANPQAKRRVLLLNRVITGKEFNTKLNSNHLMQPPTGYHSVSFRLSSSCALITTYTIRSSASPVFISIMKKQWCITMMRSDQHI